MFFENLRCILQHAMPRDAAGEEANAISSSVESTERGVEGAVPLEPRVRFWSPTFEKDELRNMFGDSLL